MTRYKTAAGGMELAGEVIETAAGPTVPLRAVVATIDHVDLDGDTYEPGAFADAHNVIVSSWQHNAVLAPGLPPVGSGRVDEVGNKAVFTGHLWLATSGGRDTYELLRRRGPTQQWSFGFDIRKARTATRAGRKVQVLQRLDVYEVSPVRRGAGGPMAHTLNVGQDDDATAAAVREYARYVAAGLAADLRREVADLADIRHNLERTH